MGSVAMRLVCCELDPPPQVDGLGTNYWAVNSGVYTSVPEVDNPPPDSDIVRMSLNGRFARLSFLEPVTNPVMAILSLGQPDLPVQYGFRDGPDLDEQFTILNSGAMAFRSGCRRRPLFLSQSCCSC